MKIISNSTFPLFAKESLEILLTHGGRKKKSVVGHLILSVTVSFDETVTTANSFIMSGVVCCLLYESIVRPYYYAGQLFARDSVLRATSGEDRSLARARVRLSAPRRLTADGNLRHKVRTVNPRCSDLLYLSPATVVKRYPFDISLHAT